ncbi:hypothetical protein [Alsobacter sp. SYSU BS001988]
MPELRIYPLYAKTDGSVVSLGDVRSFDDAAAVVTAARHIREQADLGTIGAEDVVWMMGPGGRVVLRPVQVSQAPAPPPQPIRAAPVHVRPRNSPPFCGCEVCGSGRRWGLRHDAVRPIAGLPELSGPWRRFEAAGLEPAAPA